MTPNQEFEDRRTIERSTDPNLPSRVRERIEHREIIREGGNGKSFGLGALVVLLVVAVGGFLWWNSRGVNQNATSVSTVTTNDGAPGIYGSSDVSSSIAPMTTNDGGAPMDETASSFGIAIGSFDNEGGANAERTRLNALTDQPVSISTTMVNGVTQYTVVLGSFTSRAAADSVGRSLANSTSMSDWRVVPIQ